MVWMIRPCSCTHQYLPGSPLGLETESRVFCSWICLDTYAWRMGRKGESVKKWYQHSTHPELQWDKNYCDATSWIVRLSERFLVEICRKIPWIVYLAIFPEDYSKETYAFRLGYRCHFRSNCWSLQVSKCHLGELKPKWLSTERVASSSKNNLTSWCCPFGHCYTTSWRNGPLCRRRSGSGPPDGWVRGWIDHL